MAGAGGANDDSLTPGVGIIGAAGSGVGVIGVGGSTGVGSGTWKACSCSLTIAFSSVAVGIGGIMPPLRLASLASSLFNRSLMSTGETLGLFKG